MGTSFFKSALRSPAKEKPAATTPNKAPPAARDAAATPPLTEATSIIRDATVVFGAAHGTLLVPIKRRIAQYLQPNCYTLLIGDVTPVPLRGTTSRALHKEIMTIRAPFHLVLTDLGEGDIMYGFLHDCKHVVSCCIQAPNITCIEPFFLRGCNSLSSFDTSG